MRISTSQMYSQCLKYMGSSLSDVSELNAMNASQKRLNNPSDDPAGMGKVMDLRAYDAALSGYVDNCGVAGEYLSLADEVLQQASENLTAVLEQAEQAATETYTDVQMEMMGDELGSYIDSLFAISNTQMGTDYIFAGDDFQSNAFEKGLGVTLTNDSLTHADFVSITGEIDATVLQVRFESAGQVGTDALNYSYSTDNGDTWQTATLAAGDTTLTIGSCEVELAAGIAVTAADDDGNGTRFMVREAMRYTGGDETMSVSISSSSQVDMTTCGNSIFGGVDPETGQPYEGENLFETLCDCMAYMETGDSAGVAECVEKIRSAYENVEAANANVGARESKIDYTKASLSVVRSTTSTSISREEDADTAQILVEYEQANTVYQAVLSTTSKVMSTSLLDYL